jgi:YesN/AraC family two-component response regulator
MAARVLVVDDEAYIRDLIRDTLRARQYQTGTAANGVEALDILSRGSYDILVTDVVMPGMNGLDLVKQVRRHHPRIHIIVLTGFPRSADIGDFLAEGVDDFLSKPFRANDLVTVIRRLEQKIEGAAGGTPSTGPSVSGSPGSGSPGSGSPGSGSSGSGSSVPGSPAPGSSGGPPAGGPAGGP